MYQTLPRMRSRATACRIARRNGRVHDAQRAPADTGLAETGVEAGDVPGLDVLQAGLTEPVLAADVDAAGGLVHRIRRRPLIAAPGLEPVVEVLRQGQPSMAAAARRRRGGRAGRRKR